MSVNFTRKKLIFLCLLMVGLGAWPSYHFIKSRANRNLVHEARALADSGQWKEAYRKALLAYQNRPNDPDCARTLAFILGRSNLALDKLRALGLWSLLEERDQLLPQDINEMLKAAFELNRSDLIDPHFTQALEAGSPEPEILKAAAYYFARQSQFETAVAFGITYMNKAPEDQEATWSVIEWLYQMNTRQSRNQAKVLLEEMLDGGDSFSEKAAVQYATRFAKAPEEIARCEAILKNVKEPSIQVRLALWDLELRKNNDDFSTIAMDVKTAFDQASIEDARAIVQWINKGSHYVETLSLMDVSQAVSDSQLLLGYLDALFFTKKFDAISTVLAKPDLPLPAGLTHLFRCRLAELEGDFATANRQWDLVVRMIESSPGMLEYTADYASSLGWFYRANEIYRLLVEIPQKRNAALLHWVLLAEQNKDLDILVEALERFHNYRPQNQEVEIVYIYARLLAKKEIDECRIQLRSFNENNVGAKVCRLLMGLFDNDEDQVRALSMELLPLAKSLPREGWKAVLACGLTVSGETEAALPLLYMLDESALLPQEKSLLESYGL